MVRISSCCIMVAALLVIPAPAFSKVLIGFGGDGGSKSDLDCGRNSVLVGLDARYGDFMDSVEILCRKVDANGRLGQMYQAGRAGGNGGQPHCKVCAGFSVVAGIGGGYGRYINSVTLICYGWDPERKVPTSNEASRVEFAGSQAAPKRLQDVLCDRGSFATGLFVWAGAFVDHINLICDPYEP
jgi:hypothetical protein